MLPNLIFEGQALYEGYIDMITGFNIRCWTITGVKPGRVHVVRPIWGIPLYETRAISEIGRSLFLRVDDVTPTTINKINTY